MCDIIGKAAAHQIIIKGRLGLVAEGLDRCYYKPAQEAVYDEYHYKRNHTVYGNVQEIGPIGRHTFVEKVILEQATVFLKRFGIHKEL